MSKFTVFAFGVLNFSLLLIFLIRGMKKTTREFFFSRSTLISKDVTESKKMLTKARSEYTEATDSLAALEKEIGSRKRAVISRFSGECWAEKDRAAKRMEIIIDGAKRQAEAWRKGMLDEIRKKILTRAFSSAEDVIKKSMDPAVRSNIIKRKMSEFSGMKF